MTINIENMKLWIETLESGKYEQGQMALRVGDSYCCLGVLCDLAGVKWEKYEDADNDYFYRAHTPLGYSDISGVPTLATMDAFLGEGVSIMGNVVIQTKHLSNDQVFRMWNSGFVEVADEHRRTLPTVQVSALNDNDFSHAEIAALLRLQFDIPKEEV